MMKTLYTMAMLALCCVVMAGCGEKKEETGGDDAAGKDAKTTVVSLDQNTCAMCGVGGCDGESCDADAEKCKCGFHKGSDLCCVDKNLKPTKGVYCKDCGQMAKSDDCCKEGADKCDCGMHKGSPLCCKLGKDGDAGHDDHGHDHDGDDHGHDHDEDEGHDKDETAK